MSQNDTTDPLAAWESWRVQLVYRILCDGKHPPNPEEHWEGWIARRIVAALIPESIIND